MRCKWWWGRGKTEREGEPKGQTCRAGEPAGQPGRRARCSHAGAQDLLSPGEMWPSSGLGWPSVSQPRRGGFSDPCCAVDSLLLAPREEIRVQVRAGKSWGALVRREGGEEETPIRGCGDLIVPGAQGQGKLKVKGGRGRRWAEGEGLGGDPRGCLQGHRSANLSVLPAGRGRR